MEKLLFLRSDIDLTKNLTIGPSYEVLRLEKFHDL